VGIVVLGTDVASMITKNQLSDSMASRLVDQTLCLTFVTVGEMFHWAEDLSLGTRRRTELVRWIGNMAILGYDIHVAARWGRLMSAGGRRAAPARRLTPGSQRVAWRQACRSRRTT
jgi:hypothetical protein